jgi:hypothetical protein
MNPVPAVRRFAAEDAAAAAAIIEGLPDYFTDDVPAKLQRDAVSHDAWVLTEAGALVGVAVAARKSGGRRGNPVARRGRGPP